MIVGSHSLGRIVISYFFLPDFRLYEAVLRHMCVSPYKSRKIVKVLLKLMNLCSTNGEQASVLAVLFTRVRLNLVLFIIIIFGCGSMPQSVCYLLFIIPGAAQCLNLFVIYYFLFRVRLNASICLLFIIIFFGVRLNALKLFVIYYYFISGYLISDLRLFSVA